MAECPTTTTHTAGKRVECTQGSSSTTAISIDLDGVNITTEDGSEDGIRAVHAGGTTTTSADITIDVTGSTTNNTISTTGDQAEGIYGEHTGTGDMDIDVEAVTITTTGDGAEGIYGKHTGTGDIDIDATKIGISTTGTNNNAAHGVLAIHTGTGDITIDIQGKTEGMTTTPSTITTTTTYSDGVHAQHEGTTTGAVTVTLQDTEITTTGTGTTAGSRGVFVQNRAKGDITIDLNSGTVFNGASPGIYVEQTNRVMSDMTYTGSDIMITADEVTITSMASHGFRALRQGGPGDITIGITDSTVTAGSDSGSDTLGVYATRYSNTDDDGDITITLTNGSTTTKGYTGHGILAYQQMDQNSDAEGDITITLTGHALETQGTALHPTLAGTYSYGVFANHQTSGDITIDIQTDSSVTTKGKNSHGVVTYHFGTGATRSMDVTVGGTLTTEGTQAQGVRVGTVSGAGVPSRMAALDAEGYRQQTVTVNGPITSAAEGVFLANGGRVVINRGDDPGTTTVTENHMGSIDSALGIAILATGDVGGVKPKLRVDLNPNGVARLSEVLGDGDWIINDGGQTTIAVNGIVLHDGATGYKEVSVPNGAYNIWIRANGVNVQSYTGASPASWTIGARAADLIEDRDFSFSSTARESDLMETQESPPSTFEPSPPPQPVSPPPSEPEPEAMQVNAPVVADEDEVAAVQVEGDGAVHIGPQGSVRAASGIAILASGENPALSVSMELDGRQMGQVIGDDWIINDGGGTTIIINGVTLHDATTGVVPGAVAPNGAFNVRTTEEAGVRVRTEGVRVLDRSDPDPANWRISDPTPGIIADRDFSAADFIREAGTGPGPTPPPMMIEEYAPRSAVYEALPNVLLGLHERVPTASRTQQPSWLKITGHTGSQDFDRSSVGIEYDLDYVQAEAGKHFTLNNNTEAWATLQYLDGTADVSSPVQGGDIDVQGLNISLELCRGCTDNEETYVLGSISLGRYDLDLDSDTRGTLKQGVDATVYALALEAGRRLQRPTYHLIPRLRLEHASVSIERFTDAVNARVSYPDADRLAIALGMRAETAPNPKKKDGLSLWGSLDLEHRLDDTQTTARVSGARLEAESGDTSILLGLGGTWQRDRLKLHAGLSARESLGTGAESYGASLGLSLKF
ncbi:MAG: autotransporter outer membrane beta-barrel domain-containing protein [Proteobacteria bacterium]|nr:autotransporter outer membrane beta-barrel domain-containing protein [Pseudomonadota bacterium]